jgi:ABC-type uncharacterized transport system substrate-binding protein
MTPEPIPGHLGFSKRNSLLLPSPRERSEWQGGVGGGGQHHRNATAHATFPPRSVILSRSFASPGNHMISRILRPLALGLLALAFAAPAAHAHPHVYVTMKSEIVYDASGRMTGIRHHWTFDDMFSSYATQGLESKEKGKFSREELQPLAEVNVTSLKEFDFFTQGKLNGKKAEFEQPVDYFLEQKDDLLTLHFTLPLKAPAATKDVDLEIYDPLYFVAFEFAEKEPITLNGAPAACKISTVKLGDDTQVKSLSESIFARPDPNNPFGAQFANKIGVKC